MTHPNRGSHAGDFRQRDARLRVVAQVTGTGVYDFEFTTGTNYWSPELKAIAGLPDDARELSLEHMTGIAHPDDRERFIQQVDASLDPSGDGHFEGEYRLLRPDGDLRWVRVRGRTFFLGQGGERHVLGASGIVIDITERKAVEAQIQALNAELESRVRERSAQLLESNDALLRSNVELRHFAHAMAHDLQTPLRSIAGFTQLLQKEVRGRADGRVEEWSAAVVENTKRLQTLIQEILAYTRLETLGLPFEMTDLKRPFDEALASLASLIGLTRAEVVCGPLPTLPVDRTQIAQVFHNLVENGIKYNRSKPPRVAVSCEFEEDQWVFSVADNGIGIDPKHFDRVFELFRRLHAYHEVPGAGLGVPLCRRIVERHGGSMWVESRPGEGSTFYFTLPGPELP